MVPLWITLLLLGKIITALNVTIIGSCDSLESFYGITEELLDRQHTIKFYILEACMHRINANCSERFNLIAVKSSILTRSLIDDWNRNDYSSLYDSNLMGTLSIIQHTLNQTFYIVNYLLQHKHELKTTNIILTASQSYLVSDMSSQLQIPCITIHASWSVPAYFDSLYQWYPTANSINHTISINERISHFISHHTYEFTHSPQIINTLNKMQAQLSLPLTTSIRNDYFKNKIHFIQSISPMSPYVPATPLLQQLGPILARNRIQLQNYVQQTSEIIEWIRSDEHEKNIVFISFGLHSTAISFEIYKSILQSLTFYFTHSDLLQFRVIYILPGYHIFQLTAHFSDFFSQIDELKWNQFILMTQECNEYDLLHDRNIKIFVNNGNSMSVSNSIMVVKPMILFPQWNDDIINANKMKQLGCGVILDGNKLINNGSYFVDNIKQMLAEYNVWRTNVIDVFKRMDVSNRGVKRGVDIIEYVAAYGYEHWTTSYDTDQSMISLLLVIMLGFLITILVLFFTVKKCLSFVCMPRSKGIKAKCKTK